MNMFLLTLQTYIRGILSHFPWEHWTVMLCRGGIDIDSIHAGEEEVLGVWRDCVGDDGFRGGFPAGCGGGDSLCGLIPSLVRF